MNSKMSSNTIEQSKLPSNDEIISYLNNTATSIRTKSNTTEELSVQEFSSSIDSIPQVINNTFITSCPIGVILAWSSDIDSIPKGWHICDGTEGTVDLRDKFILGVGSSYGYGTTGGEETHVLTIDEMPEHNHYATLPVTSDATAFGDGWPAYSKERHNNRISPEISQTGGSQAHNNMPPYYTLYFIQKIAQDDTEYTTISKVNEIVETKINDKIAFLPQPEETYSINIEQNKYNRIGSYLGKPLYVVYKIYATSVSANSSIGSGVAVSNEYEIIDYDIYITLPNKNKYKVPHNEDIGLQVEGIITSEQKDRVRLTIRNTTNTDWTNIKIEAIFKVVPVS